MTGIILYQSLDIKKYHFLTLTWIELIRGLNHIELDLVMIDFLY